MCTTLFVLWLVVKEHVDDGNGFARVIVKAERERREHEKLESKANWGWGEHSSFMKDSRITNELQDSEKDPGGIRT